MEPEHTVIDDNFGIYAAPNAASSPPIQVPPTPAAVEDVIELPSISDPHPEPRQNNEERERLIREIRTYRPSTHYTAYNADVDELRSELSRLKARSARSPFKNIAKSGLVWGAQGLEVLCGRHKPFDLDLDGYGDCVASEVEDPEWDSVIDELVDKYSGDMHLPVELRFLFMLVSSVTAHGLRRRMHKQAMQNATRMNSKQTTSVFEEPSDDLIQELEATMRTNKTSEERTPI